MRFIETRGNDGQRPSSVSFSTAILSPSASFGGLYVPESLPKLDSDFLLQHLNSSYKELARDLLARFEVDIDTQIIDRALATYDHFDDPNNPVPVVKIADKRYVSELYHGPTRAFKDIALQPFGVLLSALAQQRNEHYLILTATSGDTGPAALDTFRGRDNIKVACLYPDGGTSDVQRLQMVTEAGANLKVIGIHGNFDDAQSALKRLLGSSEFANRLKEKKTHLSAANSVNFGRIIFQQFYHIHSYLELVRQGAITLGERVNLVIPSGNFGNALGGYYAMRMGLPVERIITASNSNTILADLINSGRYDLRNRKLIATTSPAMDILISSNIERLLYDLFGPGRTRELMEGLSAHQHYQLSADEHSEISAIFSAEESSDEETGSAIANLFKSGYLLDPHTATCIKAQRNCANSDTTSIIYSTAEWTKFSPSIAKALKLSSTESDIAALKGISERANQPIPPMISELFNKQSKQTLVIDKEDIEDEVAKFV